MAEDLVTVAMIGGGDQVARAVVERELAAAGIACFIEGSAVYGVQTRPDDAARARDILAASADLKGHWIEFPTP
jgi:hypothetical protein